MTVDNVLIQMKTVQWMYADKDLNTVAILEQRIAETGRKLGLITYSQLAHGVAFHLPDIKNGEPYHIQTYDWTGLDRAIIGEFLGFISMRSYEQADFMASALVVNALEYKPSWHFFEWMRSLNVLPDMNDDTVMAFWAEQVNRSHNWYRSQRRS
jgi:hypothetical protein